MKATARSYEPAELLDRKPPSDPHSEMMVLRAIVLDGSIIDSAGLTADHFHEHRHKQIFAAIARLREDLLPVDIRHLHQVMTDDGTMDEIGGAGTLAEILAGESLPASTGEYLRAVREYHAQRQVRELVINNLQRLYNGASATDLLTGIKSQVDEIADTRTEEPYHRLTCAQLDDLPDEQEYLVENVVPVGQPGIMAGPPKCLKTSILVDLGISVATGEPFLGIHNVVRRACVGIMTAESGMANVKYCARAVAASKGYDLRRVEGLIFSKDVPKIGDSRHEARLRRFIRDDGIKLLAIDPTYLAMCGVDAGNLFAQGMLLRAINDVCDAEQCQILLVHHNRRNTKREPGSMPSLDEIAWAGFREWARWWILLDRQGEYQPGSGRHELLVNAGGSAGHSWLRSLTVEEGTKDARQWYLTSQTITDTREAAEVARERRKGEQEGKKLDRVKRAFVDALATFPNGETKKTISERAGLSGDEVRTAVSSLLSDGQIEPCEVTKSNRKQPYDGYRLKA